MNVSHHAVHPFSIRRRLALLSILTTCPNRQLPLLDMIRARLGEQRQEQEMQQRLRELQICYIKSVFNLALAVSVRPYLIAFS